MKIGVRCHDIIHSNLDELGQKVEEKNLTGVQLALKKANIVKDVLHLVWLNILGILFQNII